MRKQSLSLLLLFAFTVQSQTLTELAIPRYFGSKSSNAANNTRTPFGVCLRIDGLLPQTVYDVKGGIGLVSDPVTTFGAGNIWDGAAFSASRLTAAFTTDAAGSSGPLWLFFQPTGNAARFDAGQVHTLRIGYAVTGGSIPGIPAFVSVKTLTALDIAVSQRTPAGSDDGAFIHGSAMPSATGKFVLLYDNVTGSGDPVFIYQARQSLPTQTSGQSDIPAPVGDIWAQSGTSVTGDYPAVIPIGSANPSGIRRVEARNADFSVYAYNTDDDGIWPSGGNTAASVRREVVCITSADAPLVPSGPSLPTVTTDTVVTGLTAYSAISEGDVTSDGGDSIILRGLCWSTGSLPTVMDDRVDVPGTTGLFTGVMAVLLPETQYHYRAFASNAAGTAYGNDYTFQTPCEPYKPVSGFWADDTAIYVGDSVNFFDSTTYCPENWNWSFVGGIPMSSTLPNPAAIVFNYPGSYNICLTTSNSNGTHTLCRHGYITVSEPVIRRIVISEIMYNPPESGTDSLEFIELYNDDTVNVNLQDYYFAEGVNYTFPDLELSPGGYVVVGKNDSALFHTFGISALKWTGGSLTNGGELILLKDGLGQTVDSVQYNDSPPWDPLCAGHGYSLELCDPSLDNAVPESWRHALGFAAVNADGDSIWAHPSSGCIFPPEASFSASDSLLTKGDSIIFTNHSSGFPLSFEWVFDGGEPGVYSGEFPPAVFYYESGTFDVSLKVTNLAGEDLLEKNGFIEVGEFTSLEEKEMFFSVFPNPSNTGVIRMRFDRPSLYRITVRNVTGQTLHRVMSNGTAALTLHFDLPPAIYFITVTDPDTEATGVRKLVVQ